MNREQAENLLAQLVFDDLDASTKSELLDYLKTDPELNERLGDMRVVAGLLHEGIALDDEPRLTDERRAEVLDRLNEKATPAVELRKSRKGGKPSEALGLKINSRPIRFPSVFAAAACLLLVGAVVALILPSFGAARRTSRQMQSNTQLRGIHQGMVMYAQQNEGQYPDDLGVLLDGDYFSPEYVISPSDDTQVPEDFDGFTPEQKKRWVHEHGSYVATSLGEADDLDTEAVAGFGRFREDQSGVEVVFKDNHTVYMPKEEARELIESQTGKSVEAVTEDFARLGQIEAEERLTMGDREYAGDAYEAISGNGPTIGYRFKRLPDSDGDGRGDGRLAYQLGTQVRESRPGESDLYAYGGSPAGGSGGAGADMWFGDESSRGRERQLEGLDVAAGTEPTRRFGLLAKETGVSEQPTDPRGPQTSHKIPGLINLNTTTADDMELAYAGGHAVDSKDWRGGVASNDNHVQFENETRLNTKVEAEQLASGTRGLALADPSKPTTEESGLSHDQIPSGGDAPIVGYLFKADEQRDAERSGVRDSSGVVALRDGYIDYVDDVDHYYATVLVPESDSSDGSDDRWLAADASNIERGWVWGHTTNLNGAFYKSNDRAEPHDHPVSGPPASAAPTPTTPQDQLAFISDLEPIPDAIGFDVTVGIKNRDGEMAETESEKTFFDPSVTGRWEHIPTNGRRMSLAEAETYVMNQRAVQAEAKARRDTAAQGMNEIIQDVRKLDAQENFMRERNAKIANQSAQNMEATIPHDDLVLYPADGPQLTERRLATNLSLLENLSADSLEATTESGQVGADGRRMVHDIGDLLVAQAPRSIDTQEFVLTGSLSNENSKRQRVQMFYRNDVGLFADSDVKQVSPESLRKHRIEKLTSLVHEATDDENLATAFGRALSVMPGDTNVQVAIEATPKEHAKIATLLQELRGQLGYVRDITGDNSDANRRVALKLREPVPINFEGNRLVNIIDYFRNTTGVNYFVNWPVLEKAGIEKDTPISLLLADVPAEQALGLVLRQAAAEAEVDSLDYALIEGIVTISTRDDLQRHGELQPEAEPAPEPDPEPQTLAPPVAPPVNPWVMSDKDQLSTFAIDVDTASYAIARRSIAQGHLPPRHTVRMEEFVNAFDYNYPSGKDARDTFTVHAVAAPSPFRPELTMLKIGVRGKVVGRDQLKPAHLVLVIDASGSMDTEDRLALVQRSLGMLLDQLGDGDRVSIVTYGTEANLLAEAAAASSDAARAQLAGVIGSIQPRGATNLLGGVELGYQVARRHFVPGGVNRVILCSDGVANVGPADADELLEHAAAYRDHGITFTSVGFGTGSYDDRLLEQLANRGDGSYLFVGSDDEAKRLFVDDLAATRPTIARDVKIQVDFDPERVRRYRLIGYENRDIADTDFRNDSVDAGEVGSGQSATALYELELLPAPDAEGPRDIGTVFVRYENPETGKVEEIASRLPAGPAPLTASSAPRFYLAASAVQFAELLRGSEHARHGNLAEVSGVLQEVVAALPLDAQARELFELVERAQGLPPAPTP